MRHSVYQTSPAHRQGRHGKRVAGCRDGEVCRYNGDAIQPGVRMTRVFICYSRKDSGFVNRLSADLRAAGIPIWRDVDDIPRDIAANTTGWRSSVDRALRESTHMLVVLSPDGVESKEVTAEWNWFVMENRPVYPVLCRACDVP